MDADYTHYSHTELAAGVTPGERFAILLTGPNRGIVGKVGETWPHCPGNHPRLDVYAYPRTDVAAAAPVITLQAPKPNAVVTNEDIDQVARSLGLIFNDLIPHNSGWFVPGYQVGYASAADAIRGLVAKLKSSAVSAQTFQAIPDLAMPQLF